MPVIHVILVAILIGAAVAVRSAGESRVLNFVDYPRVTSRSDLHKWVGNRLLLLSGSAAVLAAFAWVYQHLALVLFFLQIGLIFLTVIAVVAGSTKFVAKATPRRAA